MISDCIRCWNTPCNCGWDYRETPIEVLENRNTLLAKVIEFRKANPNAIYSKSFLQETEDDKRFMKFCK